MASEHGPVKKSIRYHHAWTWVDSLIYVGGFLFCVVAAALGVAAKHRSGAGILETVMPSLLPVVWAGIAYRLYTVRQEFVDSIAWVTKDGISVIPGPARDWLAQRKTEIDHTADDVIVFWSDYFSWEMERHDGDEKIADYLNGLVVVVHVQDAPLVDAKHGVRARGMFYPKEIHIQLKPIELDKTGDVLRGVLGHELSHAALTAMGVALDNIVQHNMMIAAGWTA